MGGSRPLSVWNYEKGIAKCVVRNRKFAKGKSPPHLFFSGGFPKLSLPEFEIFMEIKSKLLWIIQMSGMATYGV